MPLPPWFQHPELLSEDDGLIYIASGPFGAADCLELLERNVQSEQLVASEQLSADAAASPAEAAEDEVLHVVTFTDVEEARRRAVLLLLLSYDPWLGALQVGSGMLRTMCRVLRSMSSLLFTE